MNKNKLSNLSLKFKYIVAFHILFSFTSCNKKLNKNIDSCNYSKYTHTLNRANQDSLISFPLDSESSAKIDYIKYYDTEGESVFSFLNPYNNKIYLYDYQSNELRNTVVLNSKNKISAYEFISMDSIVTYDYKSHKLRIQDSSGVVINEVILPSQQSRNGFYSYPTTHADLKYVSGYFYLIGGHSTTSKADNDSKSVLKVKEDFTHYEYVNEFPQLYRNSFFGGSHYRMDITYTYNSNTKKFIFSFPASHEVFSTSDFIEIKNYCASYKNKISIPEYTEEISSQKRFEFVAKNYFYLAILYDPYRDVYYRICLLPKKIDSVDTNSYDRDLAVIILDKNLKKIGEVLLENNKDFSLSNILSTHVSPYGLMFQEKIDIQNENSLDFKFYKLTEL